MTGESVPLNYDRTRKEAVAQSWSRDGKRRCWCGKEGSRCTHQDPIRGAK